MVIHPVKSTRGDNQVLVATLHNSIQARQIQAQFINEEFPHIVVGNGDSTSLWCNIGDYDSVVAILKKKHQHGVIS